MLVSIVLKLYEDIALALLFAAVVLGLLNILLIEHRAPNDALPLVQADFPACITVHNGPIRRPDHYTVRPFDREKDDA